ncbi:hypothetical protein [Bosea sp. PAMC 26642]|uniref:hypothetical protein n=1 Tax=Bosea sp. (strain PAMC 26642) TaxID=1792307 RepID=UPI0012E7619F|nr:hypothetical protein [Bosea sp. PAMC 26642]
MIKIISSIAVAGLMGLAVASPVQSQERMLRKATAGQPAALDKAMTERQARSACQQEMRGARESKSAIRTKMKTCVNGKMQGN